jgi:hypothetical protein
MTKCEEEIAATERQWEEDRAKREKGGEEGLDKTQNADMNDA